MQLFELFAKFTVDKQDFVKDMAEAEKTGQTTATKLSSSFEKLKKVLIGVVSVAAAKKAASALMNVVSAAAATVVPYYRTRFKVIEFAVFCRPGDTRNYDAFKRFS